MKWTGFCALMCAFSMSLWGDLVDTKTNVSFPSEVSFTFNGKQYDLRATGVATRKKFLVKVYSVAHYLQNGASNDQILQDDTAKQLTIKSVYDASVQKVQDGYRESFHKAFPGAEYAKNEKDIEKFISFFKTDMKKGDEVVIRWIPGGNVETLINGNLVGTITNKEFATGLWNIWFGPESIVKSEDLTTLPK